MVCKHCNYYIVRDEKGVWKAYAKPSMPSLCSAHHDKEGVWSHEPATEPVTLLVVLAVIFGLILLLIGVYAFGGLIK